MRVTLERDSRHVRAAWRLVTVGLLIAWQPAHEAKAAELQAATVQAWNTYVRGTDARIADELAGSRFLFGADRVALQRGDIVVDGGGTDGESRLDLPDGAVHHWRGAMLIRGATLDALLADLQSPDSSRHRQADVLEWRLLRGSGDAQRVFLKLIRKEIVTVVYNTEHDVSYRRHGPTRASSRSIAVRIAEVEEAGTAREREKPVGHDRGFMWRLNSYWRYEQVADGVIVQVESLTLSRSVPFVLRLVAGPIIDSVARESMVRTLEAIRQRLARVDGAGSR